MTRARAAGTRRGLAAASSIFRVALVAAAVGATFAIAGGARAQSDDRATAEALLAQASASPVTADAVDRAKAALEQATRLRAAGDEAHAKAADGLAREWAETARDAALAVAAEKLADDSKRQLMQSLAQLQRTRALVEESIARLGRLRAALDAAPGASAHAVEVHAGDHTQAPAKTPTAGKPQAAATGSTP